MSEFIHDIEWHKEHKRLGFYDPIAELAEELEKIQLSQEDATFSESQHTQRVERVGDYISREAALEAIQKHFNPENEEMEPQLAAVLAGVGVVLGHIPSAQPVVIRCKDCKHNYGIRENVEFNKNDIVCDYWQSDGLKSTDFCSYGERRTDAEIH